MEFVWQQTFRGSRFALGANVVRVPNYGSGVSLGADALIKQAVGALAERVRRRPVLAADVAEEWQEQLRELSSVAIGLCAVVTSDGSARRAGRESAREASDVYRRAVQRLEPQVQRDPVAMRLLRTTLKVADGLVETAEELVAHPVVSADGLSGAWQDLVTGAHFCNYVINEYLPLAMMSLPERVGAAAWRERLWLTPRDIERTYWHAAAESATPHQLADGRVLIMLPPVTDGLTALERLKDRLRSGRRGHLVARTLPVDVSQRASTTKTS